ncbi:LacI family DNA-binding transcriptional regulator [Pelagibacterium limicola]|uniref:LacI family DNA-binding transcriptional regulator n=1 Tax=Pelagibacterium limicola TaxID=2791022 RepID=UPI0018AF5E5C|nr:LacI family DNA-binding transcriptional regulator [Pelagibacterium limicola]
MSAGDETTIETQSVIRAAEEGGRRRASTIIDVANEANVAIGTVSRYLNGLTVRAANRDAIETAIHRLGYRRNALAAAMKSDLTNMIGFMVPTLSEFHAPILEQMSSRMRKSGRAVLSYCHNDDPASVLDAIEFFAAHRVDCLVMDGHEEAIEGIRELLAGGTPVILYDNDVAGPPVDRVLVDNRTASARAVGHLLDIGHTRVAVLAGSLHDYAGSERLAGYKQAMVEHSVEIVPEYIAQAAWTESGGYAEMLRLLSLEEPPTAVFCCNYNMTVGALALLKEYGRRVPEDISIVSFDDVPLFRLREVGITTVAQPVGKIAETIAGIIASRLSEDGAHHAPHSITLACDIILRESTRRPHAASTPGSRADV